MSNHEGENLKKYLKVNDISITDFAKKINRSRENVYDVFKRQQIDRQLLKEITQMLEVSDTFFSQPAPLTHVQTEPISNDSFVWLPYIPVSARAGRSNYPNTTNPLTHVNESFPVYRGALPRNYEDHMVLEINGDSMEPTLQNGDKVLCKILDRTVWKDAHKVVIIVTESDFIVKSVVLKTDSLMVVTSDNPAGPKNIQVRFADIIDLYQVIELISRKIN